MMRRRLFGLPAALLLVLLFGARPGGTLARLTPNGTVYAWGHNGYGQLGDGDMETQTSTPVPVALSGVVAVAGGNLHSLALKNDGTVWAWGWNSYGQLGDGTTGDPSCSCRVAPVPV